jgi:hypothetical protein
VTGGSRYRPHDVPSARRVGGRLVWWVLLMSFWVVLDNSIASAELLAGAGAAALGAFLAELAFYKAATRFRMRIGWVVPAFRLPGHPGHGRDRAGAGLHRDRRPVPEPRDDQGRPHQGEGGLASRRGAPGQLRRRPR